MHILMYLCRVSFLITLNIYKDYFKGRHKVMQEQYMHCVIGSKNSSSSSFSLKKLLRLYVKDFVTKELPDLHCWWIENYAANNLLQVGGVSHVLGFVLHWLVTYWDLCIERRDCCYNISLIGYWGKGSTVGWYFPIPKQITCIKFIFHCI